MVPAAITGAEPGSLLELRTAGNVIPAFDPHRASSETATVEFAVVQPGVSETVVRGHSHCGAVSALHSGRRTPGHLPTTPRRLAAHAPHRTGRPTPGLREEGREHVLARLRTLEDHPFVRDRIASGRPAHARLVPRHRNRCRVGVRGRPLPAAPGVRA